MTGSVEGWRFSDAPWSMDVIDKGRDAHILGAPNGFCCDIIATVDLTSPEGEANASLIAAAPELLAAAQDALQALVGVDKLLHEHGMMSGVECPAIAPLRAAIAKASTTGEG